ncbi:5-formyltetrahydrofolate cyclo-ligase [Marinilactibacillus piezotolerans]|uniref:5-formyltetrahydrofolate cyclo-ligase n=1 Tax=Marinilactibacillus piezotolerans TaxID=258723 RepID=A0A1I3Z706_9LACT|nr:5-formyltetrahydrofolate cyclo-ligase [Marinilactibacillus piezotolerans]SFK39787.1 5-formyltetrahydrofolate cyclo-ligase [Marinilactibacillus piezotolerans]
MIEKEKIRNEVILTLKSFSETKKKSIEQTLYTTLFSSVLWKQAQVIGVTLSKGFEWDTTPIIKRAWQEGKKVGVPKSIHASRELNFYQIEQFSQVKVGYFDIREPIVEQTKQIRKDHIELMLVPGVAFTEKGYRIGFGGGYYDRFLMDYSNPTLSLLHSDQIVTTIPVETHDVPVNYLITERGIFSTVSTEQSK